MSRYTAEYLFAPISGGEGELWQVLRPFASEVEAVDWAGCERDWNKRTRVYDQEEGRVIWDSLTGYLDRDKHPCWRGKA